MTTEKLFSFPAIGSVNHTDQFNYCQNKIIIYGLKQQQLKSIKRSNSIKRPQTSISITKSLALRMEKLKKKKQSTEKNMKAKKDKENIKIKSNFATKRKIIQNKKQNLQQTPQNKLLTQITNPSRVNESQKLFTQIAENKKGSRYLSKKNSEGNCSEQNIRNLSSSRSSRASGLSKQLSLYKSKDMFPLQKSISVNPKEIKKFGINRWIQKKKNQQLSLEKQSQLNKIAENQQNQAIKNSFNPILNFLLPKDKYSMCYQTYLDDLQENYIQNGFPQAFPSIIDQSQKRRNTYFNNEVNKLKQTIQQQSQSIKLKQQELKQLKFIVKSQNQTDKMHHATNNDTQSQQIIKKNKNRLSEIIQQNVVLVTPRQQNLNQKQRKITEQIQEIDERLKNKLTKDNLFEREQNQTNLLLVNSKSGFYFNQNQQKNQVCRLQDNKRKRLFKQKGIGKFFRRAEIVDYLNKQFYQQAMNIYQVMIQKDDNFQKKRVCNYGESSIQQSQSYLQYFFNERQYSRVQNQQEEYQVFQDIEFHHQNIFFQNKKDIHWICNTPEPQSSLFPNKIILPNHYVMTQNYLDYTANQKTIQFIQMLNYLINASPMTIKRLIQSPIKNVYGIWLWLKGRYQFVYIDGYFPYNGKLNSLYGWIDQYIWFAVLSKAVAKIMGSYQILQKLTIEDTYKLLTGKNIQTIQKPYYLLNQQTQIQEGFLKFLRKQSTKSEGKKIFVINKKIGRLFLIKWIKGNQIKLISCNPKPTKLTFSLNDFLNSSEFKIMAISQQDKSYATTEKYELQQKNQIISFHLKCNKATYLQISTLKLLQQEDSGNYENFKKKQGRRILFYQIGKKTKNENKQKQQEMIFKCMSKTKTHTDHQMQELNCYVKKGEYKIFIQCGSSSLGNHFNYDSNKNAFNSLNKTKQTKNTENKSSQNLISIISQEAIVLQTGKKLQNFNKFKLEDKKQIQTNLVVQAEDQKSFYKVKRQMKINEYS